MNSYYVYIKEKYGAKSDFSDREKILNSEGFIPSGTDEFFLVRHNKHLLYMRESLQNSILSCDEKR